MSATPRATSTDLAQGVAELREVASASLRSIRILRKHTPHGPFSRCELLAYQGLVECERLAVELLTQLREQSW